MADTSSAATPKRKPAENKTTGEASDAATPRTQAIQEASAAHGNGDQTEAGANWRDQAGEFAGQAKATARDAATTAKNTTGEALVGLSKLISDTAETVDSKLGPQYGDYARKAAETVAGAAKSLDEKDIDQLAEDARNFVRKSPAVAIGAAAVVGFVLMRMMRGNSNDA